MTKGSVTENIVSKAVSLDGKSSYEKITQIKTYWNNMNPYIKRAVIFYTTVSILCYGIYNYQDGKNALLETRRKFPNALPSEEWKAIKNGIHGFDNFFSAVFFPYSVAEKVMPSIILFLNPKK